MTATNETAPSGEQKHKSRRSKFIRYSLLLLAASFIVGLGSGTTAALIEEGTIPAWLMIPVVVFLLIAMVWASRDYFSRIDELDMADNLWSSLIGLYFAITVPPLWLWLHDAGLVGEPQLWPIWGATMAVALGAYLIRKLGWR